MTWGDDRSKLWRVNPSVELAEDHPLLTQDRFVFACPTASVTAKPLQFLTLDGRQVANCSHDGGRVGPSSTMWVDGQALLEVRSGVRPESTYGKVGAYEQDEWSILDPGSRELIGKLNTVPLTQWRDLFAMEIRDGNRLRLGALSGVFRVGRCIPLLRRRLRRRSKVELNDREVARIELDDGVKGATEYLLRFRRRIEPGERILTLGVCMIVARTGLP